MEKVISQPDHYTNVIQPDDNSIKKGECYFPRKMKTFMLSYNQMIRPNVQDNVIIQPDERMTG